MGFIRRVCMIFMAVMLIYAVCIAYGEESYADLSERFAEDTDIEIDGITYRLRKRITTLLIAGTDERINNQTNNSEYRNGGQADFLMLVVKDDNRDTLRPIMVDRDTMAEITVLNVFGEVSGTRTAQLCIAHSFGDGGEMSCRLLTEAVSRALMNIPIDHYVVMSLDGIAAINDALGGVEVFLEDDFSAYDSEMTAGKTVLLKGIQAEYFVRERYYVGEQSNSDRMERQKVYISAAAERLRYLAGQGRSEVQAVMDAIEPYVETDMNSGMLMNISSSASDYEILPLLTVDGEHAVGDNGFIEFYPDEESLKEVVIEAFYAPVE